MHIIFMQFIQALPNRAWKGKVSDLGSANLAKLARTLAEGQPSSTLHQKPCHIKLIVRVLKNSKKSVQLTDLNVSLYKESGYNYNYHPLTA